MVLIKDSKAKVLISPEMRNYVMCWHELVVGLWHAFCSAPDWDLGMIYGSKAPSTG